MRGLLHCCAVLIVASIARSFDMLCVPIDLSCFALHCVAVLRLCAGAMLCVVECCHVWCWSCADVVCV